MVTGLDVERRTEYDMLPDDVIGLHGSTYTRPDGFDGRLRPGDASLALGDGERPHIYDGRTDTKDGSSVR